MEKSIESILPSLFISTYGLVTTDVDFQKYNRMEKSIEFVFPSEFKSAGVTLVFTTAAVTDGDGELLPPPPPPPPPPDSPLDAAMASNDLEETELSVPKYATSLK